MDSVDAVKSYAIVADNMAIGTENLGNLRHGVDNMVFSWGGFETLDSGYNNVGIGQYVMGRLTAGHFNVAVGHGAGYRTTSGDRNIFVGDSSGYGAGPGTPMTGVTFLGSRTRYTGTNLFNRTAIGDSALVSQDNFIALGNTGTKVGIARATATESIHTDGAILIGAAAATTDGTIQWTGSDFQGRKGGAWKSFTAPSIADLTGLTSNSIYYVNNSGVITALPLGTTGKVLTTNGATSAPTWETPSGTTYTANLPIRITSTVISADTSIAYVPSLTTNNRLYNLRDSLVSAGWGPSTAPTTEPRYQYYMGDVSNVWTWSTTGTGSQILGFPGAGTSPDGWNMGRSCETGTTSTGMAYHYIRSAATYAPISISSSFRYNIGQKMRLEDLSDGTDTYIYYFGFMDDIAIASTVDGAFFRYNYADSSGKWIICTRSNSSATEKQTSTTVAADTDYELEINIYAGTAYFYINDVLAGTITTNLPSGSSRITSGVSVIVKTNGTNNRKSYIEWMAEGRQNN